MAASLNSNKLSKSKFKNWLKAGLAVYITKEGITPFVYDEIEQFQRKCLSDICNNYGLPAGTTCSGCHTENIIKCPTNRICNVSRGKCGFHRNPATQYLQSGCPGKICHNFKDKIQKAHRYYGPSYRNTDATQWCNNPWEVAKCFMPPDGYMDVLNAAETDFNGINSVVINFKDFQSKVQDDLSKENNIFEQGRDVGKEVRHSPCLEVEDYHLQNYFTVLQNLLSDPGYLAYNSAAQDAKRKLLQLQNDTLVIGIDDVQKVLDDIAETVQNKIETQGKISKSELEKALTSAVEELEIKKNESLRQLVDEGIKQLKAIDAEAGKGVKRIATETDNFLKQVEDSVKKVRAETNVGMQKLSSETDHAVKQIEGEVDKGIKKMEVEVKTMTQIRESLTTTSEVQYNKCKKELKDGLATFYLDRHSTVPLSPLFEEKDTLLEGFYVLPQMKSIENTFPLGREIKSSVKSLSALFQSDSKVVREIYLIADAGLGKTVFSKYLAVMWCHAHSSDDRPFKEDHLSALSEFEFLFLVSLRESAGVCNIDDMIKQQIWPHISFSFPPTDEHFLEILHREKYLVILDGLDEWNHPNTQCTKLPKDIPHRIARKKCTILTTTRPWKLSVINLKTSQVDRKIELVKLNDKSSWQLQFNALKKIHPAFDDEELIYQTNEFSKVIGDYELEDLRSVPLLLMFLISLWCDDIPLGQSKFGLYTSIIELLLSRAVKEFPDQNPPCEPSQSGILQYFIGRKHCKAYITLLTALGRLAFHTLFSETKENTLVFDSSIAKQYLSESELQYSLRSGLITQSKVQEKLTEQSSKVSFSHKSVQEYFSALNMSCQSEKDVKEFILKNCRSLQNILDMSTVFAFISRLNAKMMSSISRELMCLISEEEIISKYRSLGWYYYKYVNPLKDLQSMYISCLKENPDNNDLKLCLQDFIIDKECRKKNYNRHLKGLVKQNKKEIKSVSIYNKGLGSLSEIIDSFTLSDLNNLHKLYYRGECEEKDIARLLSRTVKCVCVVSSKWQDDHFEDKRCSLSPALNGMFRDMPQLEAIYISNFEMSHHVLEEFYNYLKGRTSMKQIRLHCLFCSNHGPSCEGFNLDLSQFLDLSTLELNDVRLSQLKINVASLEECTVGKLSEPDILSSYLSQLPEASKLNALRCWSLQSSGDIEALLQTLPLLVHVKEVTFYDISLGKRSLRLSPEMVNIENVWLYKVIMSGTSLYDLVKLVEQLPLSVKVSIRDCTITPESEFKDVKKHILRRSEKFLVTFDGVKLNQYVFEFEKLPLIDA